MSAERRRAAPDTPHLSGGRISAKRCLREGVIPAMHRGHDLRIVLRGWRQAPAPAILIVLTLGLAIGANSATFSLIDRVALRPLPVEKPYEIVMVNAFVTSLRAAGSLQPGAAGG